MFPPGPPPGPARRPSSKPFMVSARRSWRRASMPHRPIAVGKGLEGRGWRKDDSSSSRPLAAIPIAGRRPRKGLAAAQGKRLAMGGDHGAIGKILRPRPMQSLAVAADTLFVQQSIEIVAQDHRRPSERARYRLAVAERVGAPAFHAGP